MNVRRKKIRCRLSSDRFMPAQQISRMPRSFAIAPGMIPGYGMGNALDLNVQDKLGTDVNTFFQTTQQYLGALNQRPEISMAYSTF